ncbi:MAG: putative bifunctional diguanylate cyclase/phosphodiesterase [Tepidibacillus sp.]
MNNVLNDTLNKKDILIQDLLGAIENNQFVLYYQPIIQIDRNQIIGVEALVRWNHPKYGLISPIEFIPIAEKTGMIFQLGNWVIKRACEQMKELERKGFPKLRVMVNISPLQLVESSFLYMVKQILSETRIEPYLLDFEITESVEIEPTKEVLETVKELKSLGIHMSMDDFGTGFSSLIHLRDFPFDTVKIDQTFVKNLEIDPTNQIIIENVIVLGKKLKLRVIAEGVETAGQLDFLKKNSCFGVQGYYFSKPIPYNELLRFMQKMNLKVQS